MYAKLTSALLTLLLSAAALSCGPNSPDEAAVAVTQQPNPTQIVAETTSEPPNTPNAPDTSTPTPRGEEQPPPKPPTLAADNGDQKPEHAGSEGFTDLKAAYAEDRADRPLDTLHIPAGIPVKLTAYGVDSQGNHHLLNEENVTWSTDEPDRFTISGHQVILATHQATALLTLTHEGQSKTFRITAEGPPFRNPENISHLVLRPKNVVLTGLSDSEVLTVQAAYDDGSVGPLPQNLTVTPAIVMEKENVATVGPNGRITPTGLGITEATATLLDSATLEPSLIHVVPVQANRPDDASCVTNYPDQHGPKVHANSFAVQLYPTQDTQEAGRAIAQALGAEHAQYIVSRKAHILHFPCPSAPQNLLYRRIDDTLSDLYNQPQVAYAAPQTTADTSAPTSFIREETPTQLPPLNAVEREGDNIIRLQAEPRSFRLIPEQKAELSHITAYLTDGSTRQLAPNDPDITYVLQLLNQEDGASHPEDTRHILLNAAAQFSPFATAKTNSYNLVAHYKEHRTRARIDVRATRDPIDSHQTQCSTESLYMANIMLEVRHNTPEDLTTQVAEAIGGIPTGHFPVFNGATVEIPCSSPHHSANAVKTALEFPGIASAYLHIPTRGDSGPEVVEPVVPQGQQAITLRVNQTMAINISQARFTDMTTGPIPEADLLSTSIRSDTPEVAETDAKRRTVTAKATGSATIEVLYQGRITSTIALRVLP